MMFVKHLSDYYDLDKVYKFNISIPKKQENGEMHQVITLFFPTGSQSLNQENIYFSSVQDKEIYDQIVTYLLQGEMTKSKDKMK